MENKDLENQNDSHVQPPPQREERIDVGRPKYGPGARKGGKQNLIIVLFNYLVANMYTIDTYKNVKGKKPFFLKDIELTEEYVKKLPKEASIENIDYRNINMLSGNRRILYGFAILRINEGNSQPLTRNGFVNGSLQKYDHCDFEIDSCINSSNVETFIQKLKQDLCMEGSVIAYFRNMLLVKFSEFQKVHRFDPKKGTVRKDLFTNTVTKQKFNKPKVNIAWLSGTPDFSWCLVYENAYKMLDLEKGTYSTDLTLFKGCYDKNTILVIPPILEESRIRLKDLLPNCLELQPEPRQKRNGKIPSKIMLVEMNMMQEDAYLAIDRLSQLVSIPITRELYGYDMTYDSIKVKRYLQHKKAWKRGKKDVPLVNYETFKIDYDELFEDSTKRFGKNEIYNNLMAKTILLEDKPEEKANDNVPNDSDQNNENNNVDYPPKQEDNDDDDQDNIQTESDDEYNDRDNQ